MSIDKLYMKTDEDLNSISDKKQILTTYEKLFKLLGLAVLSNLGS
jgi:hypothetical protein